MRHDRAEEPYVRAFEVRKVNKRVHIWDIATDRSIYTPPDFLRPLIRNRKGLQALACRLAREWQSPIGAIMAFETDLRPDRDFSK